MFKTIRNAWKVDDIRKKMLITVFILFLYCLGSQIPVPFIDSGALSSLMSQTLNGSGSILEYLNLLSGNAFSRATLFALSVSPYITAQIVMQLLCIAIPALERLSKDGDEGREKINKISRYLTVALGIITAYGYYTFLGSSGYNILARSSLPEWFRAVVIIACYSAGAVLIMWLGEKITEYGIGNGISLILFVNIISRGPEIALSLWNWLTEGTVSGVIVAVVAVIVAIVIVIFVVFITNSERRIPIQYSKRVVGRKMYGGQSTNLPIKLNMAGVMPIIFANAIVALPGTIALFFGKTSSNTTGFLHGFLSIFDYNSWLYIVIFVVLIVAFSYFYISISFDPVEISNNLRSNGGYVMGIRPGQPTADYITKILNKITLIGAIFLAIIAVLPLIINKIGGGAFAGLAFSGTSLLIVIGVCLETAREIEAQVTMRHYKGFLG